MLFFFISESLLGLIPPELFIAWTKMTQYPFLNLGLLASLSYLGGIVSYGIGLLMLKIPSVHRYIEIKMYKNIKQAKKWGGFLVAAGALLPIPFSITSMAAGIIRYSFSEFLLFALLRYVRFVIYAIAIYGIIK
ncbi:MAG: hypothetical protein RQ756_07925 [Flavobacteriaceae bacterium]|nr:hypothetical protein [Flavobacteriaceae bacterium]